MIKNPKVGMAVVFRNKGGNTEEYPFLSGVIDCIKPLLGGFWSVRTSIGRRLVFDHEMYPTLDEAIAANKEE